MHNTAQGARRLLDVTKLCNPTMRTTHADKTDLHHHLACAPVHAGKNARMQKASLWFRVLPVALMLSAAPTVCADQTTDWPMARGGQELRGVAAGNLELPLALRWMFKTTNAIKSSAAVSGGRVYFGDDDGRLRALDASDGKLRWSYAASERIEATPLVLGETIYVGAADGFLHAVNAADGAPRWKYKTEDKILGGANWFRDAEGRLRILVGSYDFKVHCVDAATGRAVWTFETSNYVNGTPAFADGRIVFGGCDGQLHALAAATGKPLTDIEAGAYVAGSPAVVGTRAYAGHFGEEVLCVDLAASNVAWRVKRNNAPFFSSPAVTETSVFIGGRDKRLHALDRATGAPRWTFAARGDIDSSPVVCGGLVVFGSEDGRLYVVNATTGKEAWSYEIGKPISASPAVASGWIVIGSEDGSLYAFGPAAPLTK